MSQYIVLERINIQNANAVAGFTWGFPAITNFLGYTHALSRKLAKQVRLTGCGVVCHDHDVHAYQANPFKDVTFIQQKCPASTKKQAQKLNSKKSSNPPIIEEGKMNLIISLILAIDEQQGFHGGQAELVAFEKQVESLCYQQKLAGGTIFSMDSVSLLSGDNNGKLLRRIKGKLMPGFMLLDRANYLESHFENLQNENDQVELLDAWLDFSALQYKAVPVLKDKETPDENTPAEWEVVPKPFQGWLVPIMTGYKAISPVFEKGSIGNVRDPEVPACFVEAVHSVGEWQGIHRLGDINDCIWEYEEYKENWYLCRQKTYTDVLSAGLVNSETEFNNFLENL